MIVCKTDLMRFILVTVVLNMMAGCAASSSQYWKSWHIYEGLTKDCHEDVAPSGPTTLRLGLGLVDGDPHDFDLIFSTAEKLLANDHKYRRCCRNGYVVDRNILPIYHKLVYVELLVRCKARPGSSSASSGDIYGVQGTQ